MSAEPVMEAAPVVAPTPVASNANSLAKRVRLHCKCTKLADLDTFSKSDPYVCLYEGTIGRLGRLVGRTETIKNNLNPTFGTAIELEFHFERRQELVAVVYDDDGKGTAQDEVCGEVAFQLSHVICSQAGKKTLTLNKATGGAPTKGSIEMSFSDVNTSSSTTGRPEVICVALKGSKLRKMSIFGGPNAFYTLSRVNPNGSKSVLSKSEAVKGTEAPTWKDTRDMPVKDVVGGTDAEQVLEVAVANDGLFSTTGMGSFKTSLAELMEACAKKTPLCPRKAKNLNNYYGDIFVEKVERKPMPTFVQALASGWQVNMAVSIDYTASNGDVSSPASLHQLSPDNPNQYIRAIQSVGEILIEYDHDKRVPMYGFGAAQSSMHFFPLNGRKDASVDGIHGAISLYKSFTSGVSLMYPTNFAETIRGITELAREGEMQNAYTVLLILTDGDISDMNETIDAIVAADDAPLSIVIVGVGSANFISMERLDGDDEGLVDSAGRACRRDLVQFVSFRDFEMKPREELAAEVLREIPTQFEEYTLMRK